MRKIGLLWVKQDDDITELRERREKCEKEFWWTLTKFGNYRINANGEGEIGALSVRKANLELRKPWTCILVDLIAM